MTKPPLATTISSLLVASMIITPTLTFAAGGVQSAAEREKSRRQEYENRGGQMIEQGDRMMKVRDYEKATAFYKNACDLIPNAYIQFLRIDGTTLSDPIKDAEDVDGPLGQIISRLDQKLEAHIQTAVDLTSGPVEIRKLTILSQRCTSLPETP